MTTGPLVDAATSEGSGPEAGRDTPTDIREARFLPSGLQLRSTLRRLGSIVALVAIDVGGLAGALYLALVVRELYYGQTPILWGLAWDAEADWLPFLSLVTLLVFWRAGLYATRERRAGAGRIVSSLLLVTVITLAFAVGTGYQHTTFGLYATAFVLSAILIGVLRGSYEIFTRDVWRLAGVRRRAVLVGDSDRIADLRRALGRGRGGIDYEFLGVLTPDATGVAGMKRLGDVAALSRVLHDLHPDELVVSVADLDEEALLDLVGDAHRAGVKVRIAPTTTDLLTQRAEYVPGQGVPLFELRPPVFAGFDWAAKRVFDIAVSAALIVAATPVWALLALAVKLDSPGPVFYRDRRVGLGEREFGMFKFRSMYADAGARQAGLEASNEASGPLFKIKDDPRVTRVGRILRRLLDRRAAADAERAARRDVARRPAAPAAARLRAARGLASQALPRAARDDRALAGLRPHRPHVRRSRPARLLLPRELVDLARHLDPRQDDARGRGAARRVLSTEAVVVAYRSGDALTRCLDSLRADGVAVVVVDNGGGGGEIDAAEQRDGVRVVRAARNDGFGAGCNLGARSTDADVLVFLNPDTVVRPGAVAALAAALEDQSVGLVQARLRLLDRPDVLNSSGNVLHLSGLAWPGGYGDPADALTERREIAYASGAAVGVRAGLFHELGGFTEELFLYQEDLELSWRARLAGRRVIVEPAADVLHDYVLERDERRKEYYLERNRLVFVLTAYSRRLLVLVAPVLLGVELGLVLLALRQGWLREKVRGWAWLVRHRGWLGEHRRRVQALRRIPDRSLAPYLTPVLDPRMVTLPPGAALLNGAVSLWWRGVRVFL